MQIVLAELFYSTCPEGVGRNGCSEWVETRGEGGGTGRNSSQFSVVSSQMGVSDGFAAEELGGEFGAEGCEGEECCDGPGCGSDGEEKEILCVVAEARMVE